MRRRKRSVSLGEFLLITAVIIVMLTGCIIFFIGIGSKDSETELIYTVEEDVMRGVYAVYRNIMIFAASINNNELNHNQNNPGNHHPASSGTTEIKVINIAEHDLNLKNDLDAESKSHNAMAASVVVFDGFAGTFYTYEYGFASKEHNRAANVNTKYRVASLSKLVTAVCALILADQGKLDLDEDIAVYLGYNARNPAHSDVPITARMLMQHTSTIVDSQAFENSILRSVNQRTSTEDLLKQRATYLGRKPGTAYYYSNFAYTILGAVIEHITGKKLDAAANELLFKPLDIDAAFVPENIIDKDNVAAMYNTNHAVTRSIDLQLTNINTRGIGEDQHLAQGGLVISALDYAKILAMLGNGGTYLGERIISGDIIEKMHVADITGAGFEQALSPRYTSGGRGIITTSDGNATLPLWRNEQFDDYITFQYTKEDDIFIPNDGFFWHTGTGYGVFAQYIYLATDGNMHGMGGEFTSRGAVVVTTGAWSGRAENGIIAVCTHLSSIAWLGLGFDVEK